MFRGTTTLALLVGCAQPVSPPADPPAGHPGEQRVSGLPQHPLIELPVFEAGRVPRNVVLVIGDGMGPAQLHAAATANGGRLVLDRFPVIGLSRTASSDDWVTDSAAGATAMATGVKTFNGAIGVGPDGQAVPTLVEIAEGRGLATGLVATCSLTHATPAAFVAHEADRQASDRIATFFPKSGLDVAIGGGWNAFAKRADGRDLVAEWTAAGTTVVRSLDEAAAVQGPVAVLAADDDMPKVGERPLSWLGDAATVAARRLRADPDGSFLMVEGSQIDWGGHENDAAYMAAETLDLDRAVARLIEESDGETLIVVTADHETGGFAVMEGDPAEGWFVGRFHTEHHTAVPVTVRAWGPGAERFGGVYENTGIFERIRDVWGAQPDEILTGP